MLRRMSSSEFCEWQAYYNIDPFGSEREDLRAGAMTSPLINMWLKSGSKKTKASDWIMKFGERAEQAPDTIKNVFKALARRGKIGPEQIREARKRRAARRKAKRNRHGQPSHD